jgi:membrane-bound serine protease (ClpP class)
LVGAVALTAAGLMMLTMWLVVRSQRGAPTTGQQDMIGRVGQVVNWSGDSGWVHVYGETWRARGATGLERGRSVRVTGVDGLTLSVEPAETAEGRKVVA